MVKNLDWVKTQLVPKYPNCEFSFRYFEEGDSGIIITSQEVKDFKNKKTMKAIYFILLLVLITSCMNNNKILTIYICEPKYDDSAIRSSDLELFYDFNNKARKITIKKINLKKSLNIEIDKLKQYLIENNTLDTKMGIYYFSIVRGKDTLYSSSDLKSWKYKNMVGLYENDIIISSLLPKK